MYTQSVDTQNKAINVTIYSYNQHWKNPCSCTSWYQILEHFLQFDAPKTAPYPFTHFPHTYTITGVKYWFLELFKQTWTVSSFNIAFSAVYHISLVSRFWNLCVFGGVLNVSSSILHVICFASRWGLHEQILCELLLVLMHNASVVYCMCTKYHP